MKNTLMVAIVGLIFTSSTFACPDLSGNYKTSNGSIRSEIRMSQDATGIFTLVDTGGLPMVIDGVPHPLQGAVTYTASCNQNEIIVHILQGSNELGSITYSKTINGMHFHSVGMENIDQEFIKSN